MKLAFIIGILSLAMGGIGCAKPDTSGPSLAELESASKKKEEDIQKLWSRKDEFAEMKAPAKIPKQYFVGQAFIMFKIPGLDYEVVGWEKDASGKMTVCGFDECNNRDIMWVKSLLPKDGSVNAVVRADCKPGKKLGDLSVATIDTGALYESVCDVTVIDLGSNTTVASGRIVTEMPKTSYGKTVDDRLLITSADKKSKLVVPIKEIKDFLHSLSISK